MLLVCHDLVTMMNFAPSAHDHPSRTSSNNQQTRTASYEVVWNLQATLLYDAWISRPANIDTEVFGRTNISISNICHRTLGPPPRSKLHSGMSSTIPSSMGRPSIDFQSGNPKGMLCPILVDLLHSGYVFSSNGVPASQWHFQVLLEYYTHTVDNLPA